MIKGAHKLFVDIGTSWIISAKYILSGLITSVLSGDSGIISGLIAVSSVISKLMSSNTFFDQLTSNSGY